MSSRRITSLFLALALATFAVVVGPASARAQEIKKAPDNCSNAHAILGWSDFKKVKDKHGPGQDETDEEFEERTQKPWVKIGWIVGRLNWGRSKGNELLEMVDSYEPGKVQQAEFKEYRVKGKDDNAKAYVAHCGHGGTCNMIAERFFRLYKGIGVPRVYCGKNAFPGMLRTPSKPTIPIPTDEELAEPEDEFDDDDDFDFDDDDDDDFDDDDDEDPF